MPMTEALRIRSSEMRSTGQQASDLEHAYGVGAA